MQLIEKTKKDQRLYKLTQSLENLKRNLTLFNARIFKKRISPDDTRTLQAHRDGSGALRDYYISNPYLQDGTSFSCVSPIIEDYQNRRFVYRGLVLSADNATGVIESNVPLSEIVASVDGNITLQKMLSEENAVSVRNQYYSAIGEEIAPLENHALYFGKPDFALGTILKGEDCKFTFNSQISTDIEEKLQLERDTLKKEEIMRDKDSVELDVGGGIVVARQDCWLNQGRNYLQFSGINKDALYYNYMPGKPLQTADGQYVYIGDIQIGEASNVTSNPGGPIQFISPFMYENVVLWTKGKNLIQYFLENKLAGLKESLGDIFTNGNIENVENPGSPIFAGGVTLNEHGECETLKSLPESVKKAVEEYLSQTADRNAHNVIDLDLYR